MANPADKPELSCETTVERRRAPRTPNRVRVNYGTVDALFSEFTRNVNDGGIFVETSTPLDLEEVVVLQFSLPHSESLIHARGRVVRVEPPQGDSPGGIAIEFDKLDAAARTEIDRLVRELRSQGSAD